MLFTILAGAKRHRLEPWAYLRDVLLRLSAGETDLESLLPDRWAASHPEHVLQHRLDESRRKESRQKERGRSVARSPGRPVRATDAAVEDRPGIGAGGRPLRTRGAERRGRTIGIRPLDRRSRLGGPCSYFSTPKGSPPRSQRKTFPMRLLSPQKAVSNATYRIRLSRSGLSPILCELAGNSKTAVP